MTTRLEILNSLVNTFKNIKKENGYNNTLAKVSKKYIKSGETTPNLWVTLGKETRETNDDEASEYTCYLDVELLVQLDTPHDTNDEGLISDKVESIIEDIDDFLEHNKPADYCAKLHTIEEVKKYGISEIEPIVDEESPKTLLLIVISITYLKN